MSNEQKTTERTMQFVPKKQFRLYKQLSIMMIALAVILADSARLFQLRKSTLSKQTISCAS